LPPQPPQRRRSGQADPFAERLRGQIAIALDDVEDSPVETVEAIVHDFGTIAFHIADFRHLMAIVR
jgi:hypothetical protein